MMMYDDDDARRRDDKQQQITTGSYYCKPRFANLPILSTYDFYLNDVQSTVISKHFSVFVTEHGTQTSGA